MVVDEEGHGQEVILRRARLVLPAALAALTAAALVVPAAAAGPTSISLHVQDASGAPLDQIDVTLEDSSGVSLWLGTTDPDGNLTASRTGEGDRLRAGSYAVHLADWSFERLESHTRFAPETASALLVAGQSNDAGTVVMQAGARISGTVTAPSGRPVSNLFLEADDDSDELDTSAKTDRDGTYVIDAVPVGLFAFIAYLGDDDVTDSIISTEIERPGQVVRADVDRLKVRCASSLHLTSPSKGKAKIAIRSTAKKNGLTNPGGSVALYRNGKVIRNIAWKNRSSWSTTLAHQTPGKKVTYKAVHTGGDCLKWFATKTVTVKKK